MRPLTIILKSTKEMNNILKSVILVIFLSSCTVEKVMFDIDEETRKEPNGKIKSITFYSISLYKKINDTAKIKFIYDDRNLPIEQIEYYKNDSLVVQRFYNDKKQLIKETVLGKTINIYRYDKKGNVSENEYFVNDTIAYVTKTIYDKKNNPINVVNIKDNIILSTTNYRYDYSKKTVDITDVNPKQSETTSHVRYHFNKKGLIIQRDIISSQNWSSKIKYDKFDQIEEFKTSSLTKTYVNKYDKKDNIIEVLKYEYNKPVRKMVFDIKYR